MTKAAHESASVTFVLDGNLVAEHIRELSDSLQTAEPNRVNNKAVLLDVSKAEVTDSLGITFLIGVCKTFEAKNQPVKLVGASDELQQLLKLMKLDSRLAG